jgi:hypothetical protein
MYSAQGIYTNSSNSKQGSQHVDNINMPINTNTVNDSNPSDNYNNLQAVTAGYSAVPINAILSSMTANNCPASLPSYPATNETSQKPIIVSSAIAPANSTKY